MSLSSIPARFWNELVNAPEAALLLDYDGTLAPFAVEPSRAFPHEGVREVLEKIGKGRTRVVLVSGRPARDVFFLLAPGFPLEIWGEHGGERLRRDGAKEYASLPEGGNVLLDEADALAATLLPRERIERKHFSVAVHVRNLAGGKPILAELRNLWATILQCGEWNIRSFAEGIEFRRAGIDKGRAVRTVLAEMSSRAALACVGDDETDEDAFRALGTRGLSLLVSADPRDTAAEYRLTSPGEVLAFLQRWCFAAEVGGVFHGPTDVGAE